MHLQIMPLYPPILMLFIFACFQYTNHLQSHVMHSQCNKSFHNQFMRFKHIHNNLITLVNVGYFTLTIRFTISGGFRLLNPTLIIIRSCAYTFNNSISRHGGCRLVHPDTWYHLFGSPIMTDAVWCIPTRGINYLVLPS